VDSCQRLNYRKNIARAKLPATTERRRRGASVDYRKGAAVGERFPGGRDDMGSSVEGLKLRRMRVRHEISCYRSTAGGTERVEDLEALREELRRLSKQIEEAEN
jgi:hypothetical protein